MSWLRRSPTPPAYAVDGVEPTTSEGAYVHYTGRALQARPAVVRSLARLPNDEALEDLLDSLDLSTEDGLAWSLSFGDESRYLFDLSHPGGSDIFEQRLAAASFTGTVERVDRDIFDFTVPRVLPADVVLASCLDVCGEVYRRQAR
jgi:hypothetical protein